MGVMGPSIFVLFLLVTVFNSSQSLNPELALELKCIQLKKPFKASEEIDFAKLQAASKKLYFPLSHRLVIWRWATDLTSVPLELVPEQWLSKSCIQADMTTGSLSGFNRTGMTYTMFLNPDQSARYVSNVSPYALVGDGWLLDVITDDDKNGLLVLEGQCWGDGQASWATYSSKPVISQEAKEAVRDKVEAYGFNFHEHAFEISYNDCPKPEGLLDMRRGNPLKSLKFEGLEKRDEL